MRSPVLSTPKDVSSAATILTLARICASASAMALKVPLMRGLASLGDRIGFDEVLAPEASAFNDNDLGMVQETIQKRRGESRVVVEDLRPALERSICGQND